MKAPPTNLHDLSAYELFRNDSEACRRELDRRVIAEMHGYGHLSTSDALALFLVRSATIEPHDIRGRALRDLIISRTEARMLSHPTKEAA